MITPNLTLNTKKGSSTITRAKFGPGMLLQSEDLEQLNLYTRDLSRLLFRSFFGCGVVCGLTVSAKDSCGRTMITVDPGVALGCIGDPIYVPMPKSVTFAATDGCDPDNRPGPLYVWICSSPKCCAPRTPSCGCDGGDATPACTREVDWYEIHLGTERPECACGCELSDPKGDSAASPPVEAGPTAPVFVGNQNTPDDRCQCADPGPDSCYYDHYAGVCGCKCDDSSCVMLALLTYGSSPDKKEPGWMVDYGVRRFIRPVLMRDPLAVAPAAQKTSDASPAVAEETVSKETEPKRTVPKKARK